MLSAIITPKLFAWPYVARLMTAIPFALLALASACGTVDGQQESQRVESSETAVTSPDPLQIVIKVCIRQVDQEGNPISESRQLEVERAVQDQVIATRDGTGETLIPDIESYGFLTFYFKLGVRQSRIDEMAAAMQRSAPEVERVVQVKIRPNIDSGPPQDVCEDPSKK